MKFVKYCLSLSICKNLIFYLKALLDDRFLLKRRLGKNLKSQFNPPSCDICLYNLDTKKIMPYIIICTFSPKIVNFPDFG